MSTRIQAPLDSNGAYFSFLDKKKGICGRLWASTMLSSGEIAIVAGNREKRIFDWVILVGAK